MIICISANPAIDKRLRISKLVVGEVNRSLSSEPFAGGKAAHVAMAAKALGENVTWIGFLGGATGDEIERQLVEIGIQVIPVRTAVTTRINLEIIDNNGGITEILEPGEEITIGELSEFRMVCEETFEKFNGEFIAVLSGSLPPGMPTNEYASLTRTVREFGGKVIVDASGEALRAALDAWPDLVKPNQSEAEQATGLTIRNHDDAISSISLLKERGARSVALTLGKDGLIWRGNNVGGPLIARQPEVDVVSTVGCGDATVAGFAVALSREMNEMESVRLASSCGAANCLAKFPGRIDQKDVERLMQYVRVESFPAAAASK